MGTQIYFDNYSPVGDITVIATCFVIFILLFLSYVKRTKSYAIYLNIVVYLMVSALLDLIYHNLYTKIEDGDYTPVYILRLIYHVILFTSLLLYVVYVVHLLHVEKPRRTKIMIISSVLYFGLLITDIVLQASGNGLNIDWDKKVTRGLNVFMLGYFIFMAIILTLIIYYRKRLFSRILMGFFGTIMVSFLVLLQQGRHGQYSFTVVSFMFPVIAMLYMVHSNPYDIEIGSVNANALEDTIQYYFRKKEQLVFMSLYLPDFKGDGRTFSSELQNVIRRFSADFFKDTTLFQVGKGHIILYAKTRKNPDYMDRVRKIMNAFYIQYRRFKFDYKIVMGVTIDEISRKNAYISFIKSIHHKMKMNEFYIIHESDVEDFKEYEAILSELKDISKNQDMNDPRVLVYCQPVYNINTNRFDTAEALMRLNLKGFGFITPDKFIKIAEDNGFIHSLTKIILFKTCAEIKKLISEGYDVKRISVNVSTSEIHEKDFSEEISHIIKESGIPEEKIAMEITESQTEKDFLMLKNTIEKLKDKGIKFYLDDFGTGFSNMERILELPFDIIKFDRSLVIACKSNERSEKMIVSLAKMFKDLNYSVLFEGIENDDDERRCKEMSAVYLQGYKYSKPIPIHELRRFFLKKNDQKLVSPSTDLK